MSKSNPKAASQIGEIALKLEGDASQLTEFEAVFINDHVSRIEKYGDDTYFSDKQVALIERIHAERVRGEKVNHSKGKKSKSKAEE